MFGIPEQHIDNIEKEGKYKPELSLIEECGELISAIAKEAQSTHQTSEPKEWQDLRHKFIVDHIYEEMAHVLISLNLVARKYGFGSQELMREVMCKAVKGDFDTSNYEW